MNVSVRGNCLSSSEEYEGMLFFLPPSYKAVSFRRFGGGGWRDRRINVSVRGSCSANRQQRLHCLQAETRNLI